jgi:diketogulonate reductase-like aldo/keto reductase
MLENTMKISNGVTIPSLGYGTWQIDQSIAARCVHDALEVGYRHIDTAIAYGNEAGVGQAVRESGLKREDIFVTSKIPAEIKDYDGAKKAIDESLGRLDIGYLDLMLIHCPKPWSLYMTKFPKTYNKENLEVWKALSEAYEAKRIRSIGVSNFSIKDIKNIMEHSSIKPMVNQIPVFIGHVDRELIDFCKDNGILVEAYSPIATGRLLKRKDLQEMAGKYNVTVPQLCIRFDYQLGTLPLPKTTHKEYMVQNAAVDFEISHDDMETLLKL